MFNKKIIFILLLTFYLTSCSSNDLKSIKRGLTGEKGNNTDEFLVRKKDPLILPPEFEKLPTPGERRAVRQETSIFEGTLGKKSDEAMPSIGTVEESILEKIKKN